MPLTFRDRDGRKVTRIPLEVHLSVHEVVNAVAFGNQAGLFDLSKITSDAELRDAVETVLHSALHDGPQPLEAPLEAAAEAMVVVAQHVGREQALELLRGPRPVTVDNAPAKIESDPEMLDGLAGGPVPKP